jgi:tRNA ligase
MAVKVEIFGEHGELPCANRNAHVTVGTANDSIKAFESNNLLKRWSEGDQLNGPICSKRFPDGYTFEGFVSANLAE